MIYSTVSLRYAESAIGSSATLSGEMAFGPLAIMRRDRVELRVFARTPERPIDIEGSVLVASAEVPAANAMPTRWEIFRPEGLVRAEQGEVFLLVVAGDGSGCETALCIPYLRANLVRIDIELELSEEG